MRFRRFASNNPIGNTVKPFAILELDGREHLAVGIFRKLIVLRFKIVLQKRTVDHRRGMHPGSVRKPGVGFGIGVRLSEQFLHPKTGTECVNPHNQTFLLFRRDFDLVVLP